MVDFPNSCQHLVDYSPPLCVGALHQSPLQPFLDQSEAKYCYTSLICKSICLPYMNLNMMIIKGLASFPRSLTHSASVCDIKILEWAWPAHGDEVMADLGLIMSLRNH